MLTDRLRTLGDIEGMLVEMAADTVFENTSPAPRV
jgi:hypothetical protein